MGLSDVGANRFQVVPGIVEASDEVAGAEAAESRGFQTDIFEQSDHLGGVRQRRERRAARIPRTASLHVRFVSGVSRSPAVLISSLPRAR